MTSIKPPSLPLDVANQGIAKTNVNPPPFSLGNFLGGVLSDIGKLGSALPIPGAAVLSAAVSGVGSDLSANAENQGVGAFGGGANSIPSGGGSPYGNLFGGGSDMSTGGGGGGIGGGGSGIGSGVGNALSSLFSGGGSSAGGGSSGSLIQQGEQQMQQMVAVQQQLEMQNEKFSSLSSVLNARHTTMSSIIQNIR